MNVKLIENYILKKNLSKIEFAQACGISLSTLYNILKNSHNFRIGNLVAIANYMNVTVDTLIKHNNQ